MNIVLVLTYNVIQFKFWIISRTVGICIEDSVHWNKTLPVCVTHYLFCDKNVDYRYGLVVIVQYDQTCFSDHLY
jgi:hypothetical protein